MYSRIFKGILWRVLLVIMWIPMLLESTHRWKPIPLNGAIVAPTLPRWSRQNWWEGTYQDSMNTFLQENAKVRPNLTRLINQVDYQLFRKGRTYDLVIGTHGYLYEGKYIANYCGETIMTPKEWEEKLYKLKKVQDTLAALGIFVLTIEAGSKATYYPEYFPPNRRCDHRPENNHDRFNRTADSLGVHYIDFNNWFLSLKGKAGGPLFYKQGIHWSGYGATITADSLVRYMQQVMGINIPNMKWEMGPVWHDPQGVDADMYDGMNLLQPPDQDSFYYPYYTYYGENKIKPKMIFIGDSYMWTWMKIFLPQNVSTDWEFWYYNNEVWTPSGKNNLSVHDYHWVESMLESKCVVILFSECNINTFGWGFVENAYTHFYGVSPP